MDFEAFQSQNAEKNACTTIRASPAAGGHFYVTKEF